MTVSRFIFSVFCVLSIAVLGSVRAFFESRVADTYILGSADLIETILFAGFLLTGIVALFGRAIHDWWRSN